MPKTVPNKKVLHNKKSSTKASSNDNRSGNSLLQTIRIIVITSILVSAITIIITKFLEQSNIDSPAESSLTQLEQENNTSPLVDANNEKSSPEDSDADDTENEDSDNTNKVETALSDTSFIVLFFVKISEEGAPLLIEKSRTIPKTQAILTSSISTLLQGPNQDEKKEALVSYIPSGSILKKASISNGVAILDFNEQFQFNEYGNAGILAQLFQIVYTATTLQNISSVQITIDGNIVPYLGGEGTIEVSTPLTREYLLSF